MAIINAIITILIIITTFGHDEIHIALRVSEYIFFLFLFSAFTQHKKQKQKIYISSIGNTKYK